MIFRAKELNSSALKNNQLVKVIFPIVGVTFLNISTHRQLG